jgi:hypothetical protein
MASRERQMTEAVMAAYAKLEPHEREAVDELVQTFLDSVRVRGIGKKSALEIVGKVGMFLVTHPRARFDPHIGRFLRLIRPLQAKEARSCAFAPGR